MYIVYMMYINKKNTNLSHNRPSAGWPTFLFPKWAGAQSLLAPLCFPPLSPSPASLHLSPPAQATPKEKGEHQHRKQGRPGDSAAGRFDSILQIFYSPVLKSKVRLSELHQNSKIVKFFSLLMIQEFVTMHVKWGTKEMTSEHYLSKYCCDTQWRFICMILFTRFLNWC